MRHKQLLVQIMLWLAGVLLLVDVFYHKHGHFDFEGWFGFYAGFGLLAAVVLVLLARFLHRWVGRDEDYYD